MRVAGLVVARQRPATAKGVTFMLLEDEHGTLNLIVPPPVHERCRLAVRGEALVIADGRLERREGVTNVLVHDVRRLDRGDLPQAEVRHIEPRRTWSSEAGEGVAAGRRVVELVAGRPGRLIWPRRCRLPTALGAGGGEQPRGGGEGSQRRAPRGTLTAARATKGARLGHKGFTPHRCPALVAKMTTKSGRR